VIDSRTHGIRPHQPGIAWLQQFRDRGDILHSGIKPQVIAVWIEDYWHPVVDIHCHSVRSRGENRARPDPLSLGVLPTVPQSGESEQLPLADFKAIRLLG